MLQNCIQHIMKEKSVVVERSLGNLKNKIYMYLTLISKNVNFDKLDDIMNKYSNTYQSTIKLNLLMQNQAHILTRVKKLMMKIVNQKLVVLLEYQNIKDILISLCSKLV